MQETHRHACGEREQHTAGGQIKNTAVQTEYVQYEYNDKLYIRSVG